MNPPMYRYLTRHDRFATYVVFEFYALCEFSLMRDVRITMMIGRWRRSKKSVVALNCVASAQHARRNRRNIGEMGLIRCEYMDIFLAWLTTKCLKYNLVDLF